MKPMTITRYLLYIFIAFVGYGVASPLYHVHNRFISRKSFVEAYQQFQQDLQEDYKHYGLQTLVMGPLIIKSPGTTISHVVFYLPPREIRGIEYISICEGMRDVTFKDTMHHWEY